MRVLLVTGVCGWAVLWCGLLGSADEPTNDSLTGLSAGEIFQRRVQPILRSDGKSSCTECHFGGVELKNYIRDDQAATFAALRDEKLIDVDDPDKSRLLAFIARRPDNEDPLLARVRENELRTFRAWIRAAVNNPVLLAAPSAETSVGTELPVEVIRHMRRDRVLRSFVDNIWSEMGRCVSCHSPELNRNKIGRNGYSEEDVDAISWVVPNDPLATLEKLVDTGNVDTDDPDESLVLLKPVGLEDHGGGPKFAPGSRTDKNFRRFLNDYAAVISGRYARADQLPDDAGEIGVLTSQHLRIVDLPARFEKKLLRADIYRWTGNGWSETPWATAENPIAGQRQLWQSMVFAVAARDSARAKEIRADQPIPGGRYLIKIYIDREDKTKQDRDYELGDDEFYGQVEIDGPWPAGYQPPKIIRAPNSR